MDAYRTVRHPLALLRDGTGLTHGAYAQLVAETHAALGFGNMAARREKVARWESGKVIPEAKAQLAMAHVHGVPRSEVLRLGWPDWLYAATGHSELLTAPWTWDTALQALDRTGKATSRSVDRGYQALSCEEGIADLAASWLDAVAATPRWQPAEGHQRIDGSTVDLLEQRQLQLHALVATLGSLAVRPLADAEQRTISDLVRSASCDRATSARLLALAADATSFAGLRAFELGDNMRAQAAYLASLRAAAAAGDPQLGAYGMTLLARQKIDLHDVVGTHALIDAAERLCAHSRPSPRLSAHFAITRALTSALQGDREAVERHIDAARTLHSASPHDDDPSCVDWVTPESILIQAGNAYVYLGDRTKAMEYLLPLFGSTPATLTNPAITQRDIEFGNTHIALAYAASGEMDMAIEWARKIPPALNKSQSYPVKIYFQRVLTKLNEHRRTPVVREFLKEQKLAQKV
ncbi:hypothetical protein [Streptomyces sp. NPDC059010]|uniref:hypothetical protein n=1 Tax=Streptomyces sp. NPDC059010 TaxID=3346695 RepID=UPI0036C75D1B